MPEPDQKAEVADIYTRDLDDPFSVAAGHASIGRKFLFLLGTVFLVFTWGRAVVGHMLGFSDYRHRYYGQGLGLFISGFPPIGSAMAMALTKVGSRNGWRPGAWCLRGLCPPMIVIMSWNALIFARISWSNNYYDFYSARAWDQPMDDYCFRVAYIQPLAMGMCINHPLHYCDRSAYGRYCCASFPSARVMRINSLTMTFVMMNFYAGRFLVIAGAVGGYTSQVITPIGVFAWKRMMFAFDITISMHDTPWKGHAIVISVFYQIQTLNMSVALACVGVRTYADTSSYIVVDWFTFFLRVVIVARAGMNSCPRLLTFLIKKQLENVPSPLPKHVESQGDKTAMRCVQAFLCLIEGETLTICYLGLAMNYICAWLLIGDTVAIYTVPMRDFFVVLLFVVLDFIQDGLADTVGKKFNDWSYIYFDWYSKKNLILFLMFTYSQGGEWNCGGPVAKAKYMYFMQMDAFIWPEWHWSTPTNLHL